jgi:hypothetical protein
MKHIKKRFLIESTSEKLKFENPQFELIALNENFSEKTLSSHKDSVAYMQTDGGLIYGGFVHKVEGKNLVFPIPDPTLVYFNNAQLSLRNITEHKNKLLDKVDFTKSLSESALNEIYNYYGTTTGFVIFLFTAIESFINQKIPSDFKYSQSSNRKTEIYDKQQIQEFLDFKTKITNVLSEATGKDFFKNTTPAIQAIWNLKYFRDDIIHTKQDSNILKYDKLIKTSLNFKYDVALESVAKFMNFYEPNYIIECDCGKDF